MSPTAPPRTLIVAHRGGAALFVENTLAAIDGAYGLRGQDRVDGVEVDVHLSADGAVIVHHDATLDRMTDATGPVSARTAEELGRVHHEDGSVVPTLDEALSHWPDDGSVISIELKRDHQRRRHPGLARAVVRQLTTRGLGHRAYLHAFDWGYLDELQFADRHLRRAGNVDAEAIQAEGSFAAVIVHLLGLGVRDINIDHRLMTEDLIRVCHDAGLCVTLWTVNDDEDIARYVRAGVYAIATDRPDRALALRAEYAQTLPQDLDVVTDRLYLCPITEHHLPHLARLLDDEQTVRHLLNKQRQLDATRRWMTLYEAQGWGMLTVLSRTTGQCLGRVGFNLQPDVAGRDRVEIGWVIDRAHTGLGYATEAAQALLDQARARGWFDEVIALILPDNLASIRVAEKLGMSLEQRVPRFGYDEVLVYARAV